MRQTITRPSVEGSLAVREGRRLSYAEYGDSKGPALIWMHGTPGARRQIPLSVRALADERGLRVIGLDRPGVGTSTPHLYPEILDWAGDLEILADRLGIGEFRLIGLSGGGPYALAGGAALPERVLDVGVLGGVAPTVGTDAAPGGPIQLAVRMAPVLNVARRPAGFALSRAVRLVKPLAGGVLDLYAAFQPIGDKELLAQPEFKAMFLDDLLHGARYRFNAPLADLVLFSRYWGFDLADVTTPVHWWHGDSDHIVPVAHGRHCSERLPSVAFEVVVGQSHLGGLGIAAEVVTRMMQLEAPARGEAMTGRHTGNQ